MPASRRHVALVAGLGLVISALLFTPTPAQAAGTGLVINEVYGGGGNAGANLNDRLHRALQPHRAPIEPATASRCSTAPPRAPASRARPTCHALPDASVPAGRALPDPGRRSRRRRRRAPDARRHRRRWHSAGSAGQVILADTTDPIDHAMPGTVGTEHHGRVIDFVGYGTATRFEGPPPRSPISGATTSCPAHHEAVDTDSNGADFRLGAPDPDDLRAATRSRRRTRSTATIAEIQGTDAHLADSTATVTTEGVVTASYPTGGFNGFYLQTERHRRRRRRPRTRLRLRVRRVRAGRVPGRRRLRRGDRHGQRVRPDTHRDHRRPTPASPRSTGTGRPGRPAGAVGRTRPPTAGPEAQRAS